jgi:hypothetical protein
MEKVFVAQRVAAKLHTTEAALDGAMVEATELLTDLLKARADLDISTTFADDVQVKLMGALSALSEARTSMVGVHKELGQAQLRMGIRTRMTSPAKYEDAPKATLREVV